MTFPVTHIGNHVRKVETWDPRSKVDGLFKYIDLSSVNKDTKCIDPEMVQTLATQEAPSRARQIVRAGDVLVATVRPNLNGVALVGKEFDGATASTGYCVLRPYRDQLDPCYLFHWVKTPAFVSEMARQATGASYPAVSDGTVKRSMMPLPSLQEQKRIAAILDKANAIRRKRQQATQMADQFLRALFLDIFGDPVLNPKGWSEVVLKEIADIRSGVTKGKRIDLSNAVTLPYMRVANVQDGHLDLSDVQDITVSPADATNCKLLGGDILLTEGGDPDKLGRGYVWHGEIENCIHQNHIFVVRIRNQELVNPLFLSAVLGSQRGKRYFLKVGKQTTGIATINKTVLSEFMPIIPPYDLQIKYVNAAKKVQSIKAQQEGAGMNLFEAISQRAFSGEL